MKRTVLTIKALSRYKGETYDGKRHDIILFEGTNDGKYSGTYRYSAPVTLSEELSKLGEIVGGYDYGSGHYNGSLNSSPIKISADIEDSYGYMWLRNPRIIKAS